MQKRDQRDSLRAAAPLMVALGARIVDNSNLTLDETAAVILDDVRAKMAAQSA